MFILTDLAVFATNNVATYNTQGTGNSISHTITVPQLSIDSSNSNYIELHLEGSSTYLMEPGKPILPTIVQSYELPFGVTNVNVNVIPINEETQPLSGGIRSSNYPLAVGIGNNTMNQEVINEPSQGIYPSKHSSYRVGCGLNADNEHVTFVTIQMYPVRYSQLNQEIYVTESFNIELTYDSSTSDPFPANAAFDMVIIGPSEFSSEMNELAAHKNSLGIKTKVKLTEDIYNNFNGRDKPEKIKYYIKNEVETTGIKYVLLIGGLTSHFNACPRDNANEGSKDWWVPVRYNNIYASGDPGYPGELADPGVISDLYYADLYKEGGLFENWDPNGDGIFAAWGCPGVLNDSGIDMYPDVIVGRLPCRNEPEVKIIVNKIISYEQTIADPSWFKKMVVVSGDTLLDQQDLNIEWNTNNLPNGKYSIFAQSENSDGTLGPVDRVDVTINKIRKSQINFSQDDNKKTDSYPFKPIAEITSPSSGDILGNTAVNFAPSDAFCNVYTHWANVTYTGGIMHIRGKSYDPRPYGYLTNIHVWIKENKIGGKTVFDQWKNGTEMYFEGEWATGEQLLEGRGGALYYMPDSFQKIMLWTSNGKWTGGRYFGGFNDIKKELDKGCGLVYFDGHGAPYCWGNQKPGCPGDRDKDAAIWIFECTNLWRLNNNNKPFVAVVGGCLTGTFNVSFMHPILNWPAVECWSWALTQLDNRGAVGTIANTGASYGMLGKDCVVGGFGDWLYTEFYKIYGTEDQHILGDVYAQTITNYLNTFDLQQYYEFHAKSVQQWELFGDPSLMIGGANAPGGDDGLSCTILNSESVYSIPGETFTLQGAAFGGVGAYTFKWDLDGDGVYDDAVGQTVNYKLDIPGVYDVSLKVTDNAGKTDTFNTIVETKPAVLPPDKPVGQTNIEINKQYSYTTKISGIDPYWNKIYYMYYWGDGSEIECFGPYSYSGTVSASHKWDKQGAYGIKVGALLTHDVPGEFENYEYTEFLNSLNVSVNSMLIHR